MVLGFPYWTRSDPGPFGCSHVLGELEQTCPLLLVKAHWQTYEPRFWNFLKRYSLWWNNSPATFSQILAHSTDSRLVLWKSTTIPVLEICVNPSIQVISTYIDPHPRDVHDEINHPATTNPLGGATKATSSRHRQRSRKKLYSKRHGQKLYIIHCNYIVKYDRHCKTPNLEKF